MKTSLKKLVAGASVATLVALNATFLNVNAATLTGMAVNGGTDVTQNTQVTTIAFTPTTALVDGQSFVVSYPADMQDASLVAGDIDVVNANTDLVEGVIAVDVLRNTITVPVGTAGTANSAVTLNFSNSHFATVDSKKNVLFLVETKDAAGAVVDKGSLAVYLSNANDVAVTARVAPILNMELKATPYDIAGGGVAGTAITLSDATHHFQIGDSVKFVDNTGSDRLTTTVSNVAGAVVTVADATAVVDTDSLELSDPYALGFGTLQTGVSNIRKMDVETASNAASGIVVTLASTGLSDASADVDKYIGGFGTASGAATGTHDYRVVSTNTGTGAVLADQTVTASQNILTAANPTESTSITTVALDATIDTLVEAGNYSDTLTYTVTGTF